MLSYEKITQEIKTSGLYRRYIAEIPLNAIVGSVGRYQDFDDQFLPLDDSDAQRWARVKLAQTMTGLPPIEVYKISDVYFILDGNHRVSIAKEMGLPTIEAYVNEMRTNIKITPNDDLEDVLFKAERAAFFEETRLDHIYPHLNFDVTLPGRYKELFEHIIVHQYYLGLDYQRDISLEEAVRSWVENVYLPAINRIGHSGIIRAFSGRTQTDLYLWIKKNSNLFLEEVTPETWEQSIVLMLKKLFNADEH